MTISPNHTWNEFVKRETPDWLRYIHNKIEELLSGAKLPERLRLHLDVRNDDSGLAFYLTSTDIHNVADTFSSCYTPPYPSSLSMDVSYTERILESLACQIFPGILQQMSTIVGNSMGFSLQDIDEEHNEWQRQFNRDTAIIDKVIQKVKTKPQRRRIYFKGGVD